MTATENDIDISDIFTRRTREAWLEDGIAWWRPKFDAIGHPLPEVIHVSVGWGYGAKAESKIILGQAFATWTSADQFNHIFISPAMGDTARVLDVLLHELIHVADDLKSGHKGDFKIVAGKLGLVGKMTATTASPELAAQMARLAEELGHYPHAVLNPATTPVLVGPDGQEIPGSTAPKKQGTRMIKCECPVDGYTVRTTQKWLDVGLPMCPDGHDMELSK